jgi:rhodanese-related sulfurtransferase
MTTIQTDCILPEQLLQKKKAGTITIIIDVRSEAEYQQQHIPDAENIPLEDLAQQGSDFNKNVLYITACGKGGGRSMEGAAILTQLGMQAAWLCGGTFGWFESNK